jgi:hypothetical protein
MPELGDELRRLADQGAREAQPMIPAEVMHHGDGQRRRRVLRDGFAAIAVAGAVTAAVASATSAGQHATLRRPDTRPSTLVPSPAQSSPAPTPTPSPSSLPVRSPSPTHVPSPSRSRLVDVAEGTL